MWRLVAILLLLLMASSAPAQLSTTGVGVAVTGGGNVVGCAGTGFNFTLACNSQYLSVF